MDHQIGIRIIEKEWGYSAKPLLHIPIEKYSAFRGEDGGEQNFGIAISHGKKHSPEKGSDRNSAGAFVGSADIGCPRGIVELFFCGFYKYIGVRLFSKINLRLAEIHWDMHPWRQVLNPEYGKAARADFIYRVHDNAISVGEFHVLVYPSRVLQTLKIKFPGCYHNLPVLFIEAISININVNKVVV
jgi:hypothetical protein